jgi:hypothetical protein
MAPGEGGVWRAGLHIGQQHVVNPPHVLVLSDSSFAESRTLAVIIDRAEMTGATDSQRRNEGNEDTGRRPAHDPMVMEMRSFVRLRSLRFFVVNPFSP